MSDINVGRKIRQESLLRQPNDDRRMDAHRIDLSLVILLSNIVPTVREPD